MKPGASPELLGMLHKLAKSHDMSDVIDKIEDEIVAAYDEGVADGEATAAKNDLEGYHRALQRYGAPPSHNGIIGESSHPLAPGHRDSMG